MNSILKRGFDLVLATLALILSSPVMGLAAALTWWINGRPILFRQLRPGRNGEPFVLYKLRTMNEACDSEGKVLPDSVRLTRWGQILRRLSVDELPQLWNVLRGDMSLVGPRPLRMEYLGRYTPEQARRHEVKPGIVGWAQIHGRNSLTWEQKFKLDIWYIDHQSLWLDVKILLWSVWKVMIRQGVSQPGQATAEEFMGSDRKR
jgi:sugar transferase EpsL